jgi:AbrB family looped-hinge helix DNA binding protein
METTRLSTEGQVLLPEEIRIARSWKPGTEFTVEETREGILLKPVNPIRATTLDEVAGSAGRILQAQGRMPKRPVTIEEMDEGIAAEIRRRHALGRY